MSSRALLSSAGVFPRPHRRGRIETRTRLDDSRVRKPAAPFPPASPPGAGLKRAWASAPVGTRPWLRLSPGLTAGGGLKPAVRSDRAATSARCLSPGLTAGGGDLKPLHWPGWDVRRTGTLLSPRLHRRGRIETLRVPRSSVRWTFDHRSFPRSHAAGGGLKLLGLRVAPRPRTFPPVSHAGGGLKPAPAASRTPCRRCFPRSHRRGPIRNFSTHKGCQAGDDPFPRHQCRGRIETPEPTANVAAELVSPGLTAGGGLKPGTSRPTGARSEMFPPVSRPGAD